MDRVKHRAASTFSRLRNFLVGLFMMPMRIPPSHIVVPRGPVRQWLDAAGSHADQHWRGITVAAWIIIAAVLVLTRWSAITWMALGDTDDNMRYLQVRDWLAGQDWSNLRQMRMGPPGGADIHWSRLVDLPIAGLMMLFRATIGNPLADRLALGIAPLLPLLPLMLALVFITRRLAPGNGWLLALVLPLAAEMGIGMYYPMRVDHHGWQLALTAVTLAGLVDRKWVRGGIIAGTASALSVAIGMEMMVYLAGAGAIVGLRWVFKDGAARRMRPYAISLAGTTAMCFVLFASEANRAPVCDALSPVWTSILILAAGLMLLLAMLRLPNWPLKAAAGAFACAILLGYGYLSFPACFTGAYQLSDELNRSWLVYIREAKPITAQPPAVWQPMIAIPLASLICGIAGFWRFRHDSEQRWAWGTVLLMTCFACGLLFWQTRAGPAAQLLAIPMLAWGAWAIIRHMFDGPVWRRLAFAGLAVAIGGIALAYRTMPALRTSPVAAALGLESKPVAARTAAFNARVKKANARCRSEPALKRLDQVATATIFTMVDLGPRILATTHHSVIAGPYHRNADLILTVHHAMDGPPDLFRSIAGPAGATYVLICPDFPEGTIYQSRSRQGFYAQMMRGRVPKWLEPVALRTDGIAMPFTLYRIRYDR